MIFIKIFGIIIICLVGTQVLKLIKYEYAIIAVAITLIVCFTLLIENNLSSTLTSIVQLTEDYDLREYIKILLKALGISYITFFISSICTSAGEDVLSTISVIAGKFEIIALCIPLATELIKFSNELL